MMRITPGISDRNFLNNVETLNSLLEDANQQVSTGKKLLQLNDSPSGSAEMVGLRDELSRIDQYRTNSNNGSFFLGVADSVLSSAHDLVTSIFTKGSEAATGTLTAQERTTIAQEIRAIRDQLLAMANTTAQGRYLFAGSKVTAAPFSISGDTVTYQGDQEVNKITIADGLDVQAGVAGSDVFMPVFQTIGTLLTAVDNNDVSAIKAALPGFESALSGINQSRGPLGIALSRLQGITAELDTRETSLHSLQSSLEDANLAQAITRRDQLQSALEATLTAQVTAPRKSLFDYLG